PIKHVTIIIIHTSKPVDDLSEDISVDVGFKLLLEIMLPFERNAEIVEGKTSIADVVGAIQNVLGDSLMIAVRILCWINSVCETSKLLIISVCRRQFGGRRCGLTANFVCERNHLGGQA